MSAARFRMGLDREVFSRAGFHEAPDLSQGWVQNLTSVAPWLVDLAAAIGIVDDASFLRVEKDLKQEDRRNLWLARYVASTKDSWSLIDNLRLLPLWFRATDFSQLVLPARLSNVFREQKIRKVADLERFGIQGLLNLDRMGSGSVRQLNELLGVALLHGPRVLVRKNKRAGLLTSLQKRGPFFSSLASALLQIPTRSQFVAQARMGLFGKAQSLSEIGKQLSLTKEMVRLIERSACEKIRNHEVACLFGKKIPALVESHDGWIDVQDLARLDTWFEGINGSEEVIAFFLSKFFADSNIYLVSASKIHCSFAGKKGAASSERFFLSKFPLESLRVVHERFLNFLSSRKDWKSHLLTEDGVVGFFEQDLHPVVRYFCSVFVRSQALAVGKEQSELLMATDFAVRKVLQSEISPLTWQQIQKKIDLDVRVGTTYFRERLSLVAVVYGRNSYGLKKHCNLSEQQLHEVRQTIERFLANQRSEKQWHSQELLDVCVREMLSFSAELDMYLVNLALSSSLLVKPLGRMVWARQGSNSKTMESRFGLQKSVIAVLEQASGPLSTSEIKQRIVEFRGVGSTFQVSPNRRIVKVGRKMWDLKDRVRGKG